jgi:flavin-dependent dehydrogenase
MRPDVDLLVLGGGPVGLGTALLASAAGLSAAVIEQRRDPVDKACGEGLMPSALAALYRLGVDPPGHPIMGIRYLDVLRNTSASARFSGPPGRGVRRTVLHAALTTAVEAAGVERILARVESVRQDDDRVVAGGVTGRYLAAADGLHSGVRRQYGLAGPSRMPPRYGLRRHYATEAWSDLVEVHWSREAEAYVTPVAAGLVGIALLTSGRGRSFEEHLRHFPTLRERLTGPAYASELRGAGPLERNVTARVAGRVLLVGDAAGYVDALTGEGIAVGLACASRLVDSVLADRPQDYERAWREESRRSRALTRALLVLAGKPALRPRIVSTAAALPGVFRRLVDSLA